MTVPTLANLQHAFRKNLVLLLATIGLMISWSLVIYYSDQNFKVEKKTYIIENINISSGLYELVDPDQIKGTLQTLSGTELTQYLAKVQKDFQKIVDNPGNIIYKIELKPDARHVLISAENLAKIKNMNNFDNSLFSRDFSGKSLLPFDLTKHDSGGIGIYYTSPLNDPNIEEITRKYHWITYPLLLLLLALYAATLRWFILPFRRVIDKLEATKEKFASNIPNPRTLIEAAYNQMARNTNILNINLRMADLLVANPNQSMDQLSLGLLKLVQEIFPGAFLTRVLKSGNQYTREQIDGKNEPRKIISNGNPDKEDTMVYNKPDNQEIWFLKWGDSNPHSENEDKAFLTLVQQFRLALQSKELQRRFVEQEKSQVSIHLARNLGHDVTNIIASIRWDLDTLQTVFQNPSISLEPGVLEKRQKAVSESLEGLNNGTQLLQEIVDVYRSFMYLEKPVFEKIDIEPLLTRLVQLFRRATTQRIEIQTQFANNLPNVVMEPRLFKLAMFNLLTNSLDAIKTSSAESPISGSIELRVELDDTKKNILVSVKDNGPGLRRSDGILLSEDETQRVFQFGYSTKEKTAGGLGLAWVYTIICEIHKGTITAKNCSSGGAEFIISLPLL